MGQFNISRFIQRQQRDTVRLTRAAWGVGATHAWFVAASIEVQESKVLEWVEEAHEHATYRRQMASGFKEI